MIMKIEIVLDYKSYKSYKLNHILHNNSILNQLVHKDHEEDERVLGK